MTRALLLILALTSCSPSCQRDADAWFTGEWRCENVDIFERFPGDDSELPPVAIRVVCDGAPAFAADCANLRVLRGEGELEVWCGAAFQGRARYETTFGEG